jgi:mannan endo-1,4-beta-mannosidase
MMVPLILLGIFMLPTIGLRLMPPEQVGLGVCIPSPVALGDRYLGIAPGLPWRQSTINFAAATGSQLGIVEDYTLFGAPFDETRACQVTQLGAVPLIQLLPRGDSLAAIADGRYDGYLSSYAAAVRAFKDPVILSFGHEMNARWWSWGYQHTRPAVFIAAWRHIWEIFAQAHVANVTWLWNVNRDPYPGQQDSISSPRQWWPGGQYVNWAGIDAYFNTPTDTFTSVFGSTLTSIRQFTSDPVLITETATAPGAQQSTQIRSLFAGTSATPGVIGFVWFDLDRREAWRLEDRPAALAAFRSAASQYTTTPPAANQYEWKRHQ